MKKLLAIVLITVIVAASFSACAEKRTSSSENPVETTTANVEKIEVEKGEIKANNYINKSLGFKVFLPEGYNQQTAGDVVLDKDTPDIPVYDYYIAEAKSSKKRKNVHITVEITKLTDVNKWKNSTLKAFGSKKAVKAVSKGKSNIGYREYTATVFKNEKGSVKDVAYTVIADNMLVVIYFENFSFDGSVKFIQDNFETI